MKNETLLLILGAVGITYMISRTWLEKAISSEEAAAAKKIADVQSSVSSQINQAVQAATQMMQQSLIYQPSAYNPNIAVPTAAIPTTTPAVPATVPAPVPAPVATTPPAIPAATHGVGYLEFAWR